MKCELTFEVFISSRVHLYSELDLVQNLFSCFILLNVYFHESDVTPIYSEHSFEILIHFYSNSKLFKEK